MMGANWQQDPKEVTLQKFAWFPVRSSFSRKLIWLKNYVEKQIYHDSEMSNPIRSNTFNLVYTQNEHLLYLLRKDER
jgi:hypothetical protein